MRVIGPFDTRRLSHDPELKLTKTSKRPLVSSARGKFQKTAIAIETSAHNTTDSESDLPPSLSEDELIYSKSPNAIQMCFF